MISEQRSLNLEERSTTSILMSSLGLPSVYQPETGHWKPSRRWMLRNGHSLLRKIRLFPLMTMLMTKWSIFGVWGSEGGLRLTCMRWRWSRCGWVRFHGLGIGWPFFYYYFFSMKLVHWGKASLFDAGQCFEYIYRHTFFFLQSCTGMLSVVGNRWIILFIIHKKVFSPSANVQGWCYHQI